VKDPQKKNVNEVQRPQRRGINQGGEEGKKLKREQSPNRSHREELPIETQPVVLGHKKMGKLYPNIYRH